MFLSTRMYFARQKAAFIVILAVYSLLISSNTLLFASLVRRLYSGAMPTDTTTFTAWVTVFVAVSGLYFALTYTLWLVKYHYFFRLHVRVHRLLRGAKSVTRYTSKGVLTVRSVHDWYELELTSDEEVASTGTSAIAVLGKDYLNEERLAGSPQAVPTKKYLGPLRGLSDAQTFTAWCKVLALAETAS